MKQIIAGMLDLLDTYTIFDGKSWRLAEEQLNRYLCMLGNSEVDGIRIFSWSVWGPRPYGLKSQFAPYLLKDSKFNLLEFNTYYFPIVKKVMHIANSYGLKTWYVVLDNCQFHGKEDGYRLMSPFVSNVNGITTPYETKAHAFIKSLIDRCYTEFKAENPAYCFGNECNKDQFKDIVFPHFSEMITSGKWNKYYCTYGATAELRSYIGGKYVPDNAGVLDTLKKLMEDYAGKEAKLAIWKEAHGIGGKSPSDPPPHILHEVLYWWARTKNNGIRIWLSDDGVHPRPDKARWSAIAKKCRDYANDFTFEHCPEESMETTREIFRETYKAMFDKYPEEKYDYKTPFEPPPPLPHTPPETESEPENKSWLKKFLDWLFGEHSWWHDIWN